MRTYRQPPHTNKPGPAVWVFMFLLTGLLLAMCAQPAEAWVDPPTQTPETVKAWQPDTLQPWQWSILIGRYFDEGEHDQAMTILNCESGFDPRADNPISTAQGGWQFLEGTWGWANAESGYQLDGYPVGPNDPDQSTRLAAWLQDTYGWSQWLCSRVAVTDWVESADLLAPGQETR